MRTTPVVIFWNGYFWVWVFFILSGFVLPLNFFKSRRPTSVTGGTFRRYLRLMLPVLIIISIYYITWALDLYTINDGRSMLGDRYKGQDKTFWVMLFDGTISTWYGDNSWTIVTWTLSIELVATYFIYIVA